VEVKDIYSSTAEGIDRKNMLSIDEATIEQKIQNIHNTKTGYCQARDRRNAFERVLRDHYERLSAAQSPTQEDIAQSLHALYGALNTPELVDQQLLVNFIAVITRFVENAGVGYSFSKVFMDKAIRVYRQAGFSTIDLYLEKANLLRLNQLESVEREQSLLQAKRYAEASGNAESLLKVLISCAVYYTEVSHYQEALHACQGCEQLIQRNSYLHKFKPKVLTLFGMNYTPLFNYKLAKSYLLQAKALLDVEPSSVTLSDPANMSAAKDLPQSVLERNKRDEAEDTEFRVSTLDTIHHYLGRIAEGEGHLQVAMHYYVEAYYYLHMFAHEPRARLAFYHLRLGELLISASLLEQARDHLLWSQEIFDDIQFASAGRLQVSLAWASLYSKEGNYTRARDYILDAIKEARNKQFPRGELWCLVKLFWLELSHAHLYHAFVTFLQALGTWRYGELRRNEGFKLFGHYLLQILATPFKLLKRTPHTVMGAGTVNARVTGCICPEHRFYS
jgi:tetratricopeptide (TPR) repeat protein